jgi:hypothetical protein
MDNRSTILYHLDGAKEGRWGIAQPPQWMAVRSAIAGEGVGKAALEAKARVRSLRATSERVRQPRKASKRRGLGARTANRHR